MADMASPTDASAGSKIFVGGLDRSVDEGALNSHTAMISETFTSLFRNNTTLQIDFAHPFRPKTGVVRNFFQQFGPVVEVRIYVTQLSQ